MSVIYVLLAISIVVAVIFFIAFIVSVKNGQYDDSYTPSVRMLFEDELVNSSSEKQKKSSPSTVWADLRGTKLARPTGGQTVESVLKQKDCSATPAMKNRNKIKIDKQE